MSPNAPQPGEATMSEDVADADATVSRTEYERLRDSTDAIHRSLLAHSARITAAAVEASKELDAGHYPTWASDTAKAKGKDPIGCAICWPQDGSWPCTSRMVADDLRMATGIDGTTTTVKR